jgi:hypothetical protein
MSLFLDELTHAKRVLEAVLMASHEALPLDEIVKVFDPPVPMETVRFGRGMENARQL